MSLQHEESSTENQQEAERQVGSEMAAIEQFEAYLTTQEVDALLAEWRQAGERADLKGKKLVRSLWTICILQIVPIMLLFLLSMSKQGNLPVWIFYLPVSLMFFPLLRTFTRTIDPGQRSQQILENLTRSNDLRSITPLAASLRYVKRPLHGKMIDALTRLLPQLQVTDSAYFLPFHQATLYTMLNGEESTQPIGFQIAVLKAFEKVGNTAALPYVQHLAERVPKTGEGRELQIAAESCLAVLQERARHEHQEQTLLRPSGSDQTPDVLLRPAVANQETRPEELLRPSAEAEKT